jgi:hypothetical protein|nr:MAG TPA: hypothetical protein [Caudoviricetes sp.]
MYRLIMPMLMIFVCLFYHDIPLEWQGLAGYILGCLVTLNSCLGKKKE